MPIWLILINVGCFMWLFWDYIDDNSIKCLLTWLFADMILKFSFYIGMALKVAIST